MTVSTRDIGLAGQPHDEHGNYVEFERSLAVVIGIQDYADPIPPLQTPVNDARAVAAVLEQQQNYQIVALLTEDVTRHRLVTQFSKTLSDLNLSPADRLLVYFAGHGTVVPDDDGEPEYYLLPQDANLDKRPSDAGPQDEKRYDRDSFLPMRWVRDELLKLECRHLLVVLDCCFAGGFGRMRSFEEPPPKIYRQRYNFWASAPAWQVLASAAYDQTALDTAGGYVFGRRFAGEQPDHSPFAKELLAGLSEFADVNPPAHEGMPEGDGLITVTELFAWVAPRVQGKASDTEHRQFPGLWQLSNHQGGEYVFRNPKRALALEDTPALTGDTNPYRGLKSYDEKQTALFFGREKQVEELAGLVKEKAFVAVLGASGTGKSSLAKAGLIPALGGSHEAGEPAEPRSVGDEAWLVLPAFRPEANPVASLEKCLAEHLPGYVTQVPSLAFDPGGLAALVRAWAADHHGGRLVLVIDQFEELVTLCGNRAQREHFQALLRDGLAAPGDALRVIITLRTDFEPQFTKAGSPLVAVWQGGRYVVPPMTQEDFRQVILRPAWANELYFESHTLVETLVNEVVQTPGGLPLLSFTLSEMVFVYIENGRTDRTLRQQEYDDVGGVIGSLRSSADRVYGRLPDPAKDTMARLMLRMVALEGGEVARRRVTCAELDFGERENRRRDLVIGRLIEARLVVQGGKGDSTWVEPAHDALVSGWDRLMEWKLQAASYLPLQRELAPVALRWRADGEDSGSGLLWHDNPQLPRLRNILWPDDGKQGGLVAWSRWLKGILWPDMKLSHVTQWLNAAEACFVKASVERRAASRKRAVSITALVMLALAGLALFANTKRIEAVKEGTLNLSRQLAAQSLATTQTGGDPDLSLLLAVEAWRAQNHMGTTLMPVDQALRRALAYAPLATLKYEVSARSEAPVMIFNQDGSRLWTASAVVKGEHPGSARLVDSSSGRELARFDREGPVRYLATGPDESRLVVAVSNTLQLIDASSGASLAVLDPGQKHSRNQSASESQRWSSQIAFDPTGSRIAVAISNTVGVFDGEDGEELAVLSEEYPIDRVAYSPDGTRLLTIISSTIHIWNPIRAERLVTLKHDQSVNTVAFSHDGSRLASTSGSQEMSTAYLWDCAGGTKLREIASPYLVPEFSSDGTRMIVATHGDGNSLLIHLLDAGSGEPLVPALPHTLSDAFQPRPRFSPDGSLLATVISDTVHVIDTGSLQEVFEIEHGERVVDLEFSPVGRWLAVGGGRVVHVVDGDSSHTKVELTQKFPVGDWLTFSGEGNYLATVDDEFGVIHGVHLWKVATGEEVLAYRTGTYVQDLAFSPDESRFAVAAGNQVHIWDSASGVRLATLQHPDVIRKLIFSLDNSRLASGSEDGTVRLWTRNGGAEPVTQDLREIIIDIIPDETDDRLLTQSQDGIAHLRDIHGVEVAAFGADDTVETVLSNSDGTRLVTQKSDKTGPGEIPQNSHTYFLMNGRTGQKLNSLTVKYSISQAIFNSNSSRLALVDWYENTIHLWDAQTGDEVAQLPSLGPGPLRGAQFSPDGASLARYSGSGVWIYDSETAERITTLIEDRIINDVQFSPDSSKLAVAMESGEVLLWDRPSMDEVTVFHNSSPARGVAFSPDGSLLVSWSADFAVHVWSTSSQREVGVLHHPREVGSAAFSSDNARLAILTEDAKVHLWDGKTWEEVGIIEGVSPVRNRLIFDADGSRLIAVSRNGAIRWSRVGNTQELATMACDQLSRNLTQDEWNTYFGERESYLPTCPNHPAHETAIRAILHKSLSAAGNVEYRLRRFGDSLNLEALKAEVVADTKRLAAQVLDEESRVLALPDRLEEALALVEEAAHYDPSYDKTSAQRRLERASGIATAETLKQLGDASAKNGDFEAAFANYHEAKRLNPDLYVDPESEAANGAASTLGDRAAAMARSGHTAEALDILIPLATRFPHVEFTVANYCAKTQGPCQVGRQIPSDLEPADKARKLLASALVADALDEQARLGAANGSTHEAYALFEQALELDPDLAALLDPEMEIREAEARTVQILLEKGWSLEREGITARAKAQYDKAIELAPGMPNAYFRRGKLYSGEADYARAITDYDKAIELKFDPLDELFLQRGLAYAAQENYDKSIADFHKAIEINPQEAQYYNTACWYGSLLGHAADVLEYCDKAVELAPNQGMIHDSRGLARALVGDTPHAISDFESALEWAKAREGYADFIASRTAWVKALREGINPAKIFDAATLGKLRNE